MTASRKSIIFGVYAPALESNDERIHSVASEPGHTPAGLRLAWSISDGGRFIPSPQRDAWLGEEAVHEELPRPRDAGAGHLVTLIGWERPAALSPSGREQFEVHAKWPLGAVDSEAAAELLERVAEGVRAYWGHATPNDMVAGMEPRVPPSGRPMLERSEDTRSPGMPWHLGWLNYWSAAAARSLGFPDPTRDADLLSRAKRTATGGWMVRLTETPLDLGNPSHIDALLRGYKRFPQMGGAPVDRAFSGAS
ncbi:hypothetical protein D187_005410 [Cystobacter fuscus DSM 2262]|uniref:Uncharacterized protein n=1 Tax=Cystobacter fuscus (strain ATCC 25194 / DSM 2262 / NBRC 100088 / M29) TaxID=1242864 RepID=S9PML1_CYSF2|nr:DUF5953 family protein [Cystobacter fuscus]EPX64276.1 hypothetical protein D187_005410 [Cystobacter fuscus DSM 2262]